MKPLQVQVSTVGWFLFRVSYLPSYVFLWRCHSFTLRKLYACIKKFLRFSCTIWSSLCFWSSMYRFSPLMIILVPRDSNVTLAQVCWLCCVLYMPLFGLVNNITFPERIGSHCDDRVKWQDVKRWNLIGHGELDFSFHAKKSVDHERPFSVAVWVVYLFSCLSCLTPLVTRVHSHAFCSTD